MKDKIKKLIELCEYYNLDLQIRYYGDRQVCFSGICENDDEIFMVSIHYHKNERLFYINLNSQLEQYRNNGSFSKEEILLLLSLDDLTDDELGIKPQGVETKWQVIEQLYLMMRYGKT